VPMAHLTCWIALDDATPDNGCLQASAVLHPAPLQSPVAPNTPPHQYIPGSHTWSSPSSSSSSSSTPAVLPITGLAGDMDAIKQTLTPEQQHALAHPVPIPLKAGCASFHHPLLVHGSFANSSSGSRRATVINFVK
jgi:ectoine hydroxylase-related dioxygenase (phytanoyl-CoA dioxygenase family)